MCYAGSEQSSKFFLICLMVIVATVWADGSLDLEGTFSALTGETRHAGEVQQDLETLVAYLRAGDLRLVRPTPIGETAKRQAELGEAGGV